MTQPGPQNLAWAPLTVLHTNDFHGYFTSEESSLIRTLLAQSPGSILLDSGDAISTGNVGVRPGGEPVLDLMTETGYLCMTMGNREFHVADALLRAKIGRAEFPILCANIRWREDHGETLPVVPNIIKIRPDGLKIGIFGLTVPMVTPRMAARIVSAYLFDDPILTAKKQIAELRGAVDVLIALTHIGIREDERLAGSCPELDCIIGGHSHVLLSEPKVVNGVPIVQAGSHGRFAGKVTFEFGGPGPSVLGEIFPLAQSQGDAKNKTRTK